jgi:hypothetical protein
MGHSLSSHNMPSLDASVTNQTTNSKVETTIWCNWQQHVECAVKIKIWICVCNKTHPIDRSWVTLHQSKKNAQPECIAMMII